MRVVIDLGDILTAPFLLHQLTQGLAHQKSIRNKRIAIRLLHDAELELQ